MVCEEVVPSEYGSLALDVHTANEAAKPQQDSRRKWLMLAILSVLSAVNQGICYSYAPIASIVEDRWDSRIHSTSLVTVYFVSYIPCSFLGSWIMDKKGLRYGVLLGGFLQALGASLRYAGCIFEPGTESVLTMFGQILASVAMPFMVNSPPVLSANWFPSEMRTTSTSVAVNANAMGIAIVYLTASFVVQDVSDVPAWNSQVALVAIISWAVGCLFFQSFPESNNTVDSVPDVHLSDEYDWSQWLNAFKHKGFWHTVTVFSLAECVLNAMSAMLGKFLSTADFTKTQIGFVGAAFIVSSLVGSQAISQYVDKRRNHKSALQLFLLLTAASLAAFRLADKERVTLTLVTLVVLGAVLGPLQPIVLELGVECAFPTSEATVAALQQLCGNFLSAVMVPALFTLRRTHKDATGHVPLKYFYASPEWIMVFMTTTTFVAFCFFDGEYKRCEHEDKSLKRAASSSLSDEPARKSIEAHWSQRTSSSSSSSISLSATSQEESEREPEVV